MYSKSLDQFFRGNHPALVKIGGCSLFCALAVARGFRHAPWDQLTPAIAAGGVFGAVVGALLAMKDAVQRRIDEGLEIDAVNRLLFASGVWSLLVWIFLALLCCVIGVIGYAAYFAGQVAPAPIPPVPK